MPVAALPQNLDGILPLRPRMGVLNGVGGGRCSLGAQPSTVVAVVDGSGLLCSSVLVAVVRRSLAVKGSSLHASSSATPSNNCTSQVMQCNVAEECFRAVCVSGSFSPTNSQSSATACACLQDGFRQHVSTVYRDAVSCLVL